MKIHEISKCVACEEEQTVSTEHYDTPEVFILRELTFMLQIFVHQNEANVFEVELATSSFAFWTWHSTQIVALGTENTAHYLYEHES